MGKERNDTIDIFRGLLIVAVVYGHTYLEAARFVFWFHMPLFFMLSGALFTVHPGKGWTRKIRKYFVPYIIFGLLDLVITNQFSIKNIIRLCYGGRLQQGVYWFITCLFISQILVTLIETRVQQQKVIVYVTFYVLAIVESNLIIPKNTLSYPIYLDFPWNIDVSLLATVYMAIGYHIKKNSESQNIKPKYAQYAM